MVQFYHLAAPSLRREIGAKHPVPISALVAYRRVAVNVGEAVAVRIDVDETLFHLTDEAGQRKLYRGAHAIAVHLGTRGGSTDPGATTCAYNF